MRKFVRFGSCGVLVGIALLFSHSGALAAPKPPEQPKSGPGGAEYSSAAVKASHHGEGSLAYWIFEPDKPAPKDAPLIIFNHGWSAMQPAVYRAWIDHLVKRGNIVVYPEYQDSLRTPVSAFTPNAIASVKDAIHVLMDTPGHVRPQIDHFAIVGHSMGGVISANMAAMYHSEGLPFPRAVMCVQPGKTWAKSPKIAVTLRDLSAIPSKTLLLTVAGDADTIARDIDAKRIFNEATEVPLQNKNYITLVSDSHGEPALRASHFAPVALEDVAAIEAPSGAGATKSTGPVRQMIQKRVEQKREEKEDNGIGDAGPRSVDALDFYGTWKLFDGLTDAAFFGRNRNYALGNTPEQRFMGTWSDGVAVKELRATDHPKPAAVVTESSPAVKK